MCEPYAPRTGERLHPVVRLVRWLLQPLGWPTHLLAIAATLVFLWDSSRGLIGFTPALILAGLVLAVSIIWIGRLLVRCVIAAFYRRAPWAYRAGWKNWLVAPALLALSLVLHKTKVPVRIGFWISKPAMERLVRQALVAPKNGLPPPRRVGVYHADNIEKLGQGVRFVVVKDGFLFTESNFGFAYFPGGKPPTSIPPNFHDWSTGPQHKPLGGNWFSWTETGSNF
ncbi:MAG TPA: hypothetical protein VNA16_09830 [Abditibacteriaceae bacterium]|nr:hypothetical protein [Abditibacteriaceae bacterium]